MDSDKIIDVIDQQIEHSKNEISKLKFYILILSLIILYCVRIK